MCGLAFLITILREQSNTTTFNSSNIHKELTNALEERGPDYFHHNTSKINAFGKFDEILNPLEFQLYSSVLHMRGDTITPQPISDKRIEGEPHANLFESNFLCWNGEIFSGEILPESNKNDGKELFERLNGISSPTEIEQVVSKIEGPFAFIFWDESRKTMWFGRDPLGRRSLLFYTTKQLNNDDENQSSDENHQILFGISSVAPSSTQLADENARSWIELPICNIYSIVFNDEFFSTLLESRNSEHPSLHSDHKNNNDNNDNDNNNNTEEKGQQSAEMDEEGDSNIAEIEEILASYPYITRHKRFIDGVESYSAISKEYSFVVQTNVGQTLQTKTIPPIYLPFGRRSQINIEPSLNINDYNNNDNNNNSENDNENDNDNNNNSSGNNDSESRESSEKKIVVPNRKTFELEVEKLIKVLGEAVRRRVVNIPDASMFDSQNFVRGGESKLAILFSGGIDSMMLAYFAHQYRDQSESIDLINVAFGEKWPYSSPDRTTGRSGVTELQKVCPARVWNFVEVNVTPRELQLYEAKLKSLVYPQINVMDMTIGPALWFAARGRGIILKRSETDISYIESFESYHSTSRVLLLGNGADEQMCGYGRHRSAFTHRGFSGLQQEIDIDVSRIWIRNLGRDDRIISSVSKESRYPFLDVDVIKYLNSVPLWLICDLTMPSGTGDKRILREAAVKLGLVTSSKLSKRAIQFGSRISHLTKRKKGGHIAFQGYNNVSKEQHKKNNNNK